MQFEESRKDINPTAHIHTHTLSRKLKFIPKELIEVKAD